MDKLLDLIKIKPSSALITWSCIDLKSGNFKVGILNSLSCNRSVSQFSVVSLMTMLTDKIFYLPKITEIKGSILPTKKITNDKQNNNNNNNIASVRR